MQWRDPKNIENQYAVTWKRWPMSPMWKGWLKFRRQRYKPFLLEMSLLCHLREKKHYKVETGGRECIHPVGERKCRKKRGEHFSFLTFRQLRFFNFISAYLLVLFYTTLRWMVFKSLLFRCRTKLASQKDRRHPLHQNPKLQTPNQIHQNPESQMHNPMHQRHKTPVPPSPKHTMSHPLSPRKTSYASWKTSLVIIRTQKMAMTMTRAPLRQKLLTSIGDSNRDQSQL